MKLTRWEHIRLSLCAIDWLILVRIVLIAALTFIVTLVVLASLRNDR